MERLTKKEGAELKFSNDGTVTNDYIKIRNPDEVIKKLHQIEEIEKEWGIDFSTLFKALKNGFYFKYKNEILSSNDYMFRVTISNKGNWMFDIIHDNLYLVALRFKDCGETWSLDRTALERGENGN